MEKKDAMIGHDLQLLRQHVQTKSSKLHFSKKKVWSQQKLISTEEFRF